MHRSKTTALYLQDRARLRFSRLPFSRAGLKLAKKTIATFTEKVSRPYEQADAGVSLQPHLLEESIEG